MKIKNMFYDDINREINGVIKVNQSTGDTVEQELSEYVITRELKKHFQSFFSYYLESFSRQISDTAVWISGFFGSGKSHFLKILSYILENKEINDIKTVERFRNKLTDEEEIFKLIEEATKGPTETILFNIDIEGPMEKDKTAVLKVFAKMFYKHLGFYGENLKVAKLEEFIERQGKTEEFRRSFEKRFGSPWLESRDIFDFCQDDVVGALVEELNMSENSARAWFDSEEKIDISIAKLVDKIKTYVEDKPADFRLIFLIDEVGQYVGADTDLLLNLQSLVEEIGSKCGGKVWVLCTGQEALDQIIKTRSDEFSRIQARFKTRLSLSSSSVDEVIQKRILKKKPEAKVYLEEIYQEEKNVMENLFKFKDAVGDIRGFETAEEFYINYPFVPYQFIIMQKVFSEIRKHGNAGKHLSGGERSMLSGFQEAAQRVQDKDENALVPFWMFYDTVHTFLDSNIRRVVERAERAALDNRGLEAKDIDVLKLLYMIRYIDDVPATVDNIIIMMAEDLRLDKLSKKIEVQESLDRLIRENYITRTGESYNFLTDDEQDIEREIKNETVDTAEVIRKISEIIFDKVYTTNKYRYDNKYDFDFNKKVDGVSYKQTTDGMEINILTVATNQIDKHEITLMANSYEKVLIVLGETNYYELLEDSIKIEKFARKKNIPQLIKSVQDIIRNKQDFAEDLKIDAQKELERALGLGQVYINGSQVNIKTTNPKEKIDEALKYLVGDLYKKLDYITKNVDTDEDIYEILNGNADQGRIKGLEDNRQAADEVENFLMAASSQHLSLTMADIQKRFTAIPYGWREIDIAAVVARLIYEQKAIAKYSGNTIRKTDLKLPQYLYKRSEVGKTKIEVKKMIQVQKINQVSRFLRDFFQIMDLPKDDDGLVEFIVEKFEDLKEKYTLIHSRYLGRTYPEKRKVEKALETLNQLLAAKNDNIGLIDKLISMEEDLEDMQEDMEYIEGFFDNQVGIFDQAKKLEEFFNMDLEYLKEETEAYEALNNTRKIVVINPQNENYDYKDIPKLNDYIQVIEEGHNRLLERKRTEVKEINNQCREKIRQIDAENEKIKKVLERAEKYYLEKLDDIYKTESISILDSFVVRLSSQLNDYLKEIERLKPQPEPQPQPGPKVEPLRVKTKKLVYKNIQFPTRVLENSEEIRKYLEEIEKILLKELKDYDQVEII